MSSDRAIKVRQAIVMFTMLHPDVKIADVATLDKESLYARLCDDGYTWDTKLGAWRKRTYRRRKPKSSVSNNPDWRVVLVRVIGHKRDVQAIRVDMITAFELVGYISDSEPKIHELRDQHDACAIYLRLKKGKSAK